MGTYGYIKHSELSHHGIKGQRWGVRNGPPYPLSESDRSAKERKLNAARKWKPNDTSPKRVLDAYARVAAGDKVAYPGYSRTKNAVQTLAGNKRGISTNVRALAGKEERIHNARRGAATYYGTPVAQAFYGDKTTANKNISRYTTHAAGKHKGAQEVSKAVIKAYAEELTGKGNYKEVSKEVAKGAAQVVSGNRNPIKKTKFYQNYRNNQIRNKFKRFENESEKIAQNKMNLFRKLDDEKFSFLDKEIKKYGFDDMEDAYAKAAKENSLLDSGKLKYQDSIWKKINDIEEKADDEFFNREYKISRDADKQTNKHAEKFLNNYFKDHTKLTADTLDKIATKKYNGEHDSWVPGMGPTHLRSEMLNQDNTSKYELDNDLIIRRKKKR